MTPVAKRRRGTGVDECAKPRAGWGSPGEGAQGQGRGRGVGTRQGLGPTCRARVLRGKAGKQGLGRKTPPLPPEEMGRKDKPSSLSPSRGLSAPRRPANCSQWKSPFPRTLSILFSLLSRRILTAAPHPLCLNPKHPRLHRFKFFFPPLLSVDNTSGHRDSNLACKKFMST